MFLRLDRGAEAGTAERFALVIPRLLPALLFLAFFLFVHEGAIPEKRYNFMSCRYLEYFLHHLYRLLSQQKICLS